MANERWSVITRVLVGYTATKAGRDALALASRIAVATGARLDVVVVLPGIGRSVLTPPDAAYDRYVREQAEGWLDLPEAFRELVTRSLSLQNLVRRMDDQVYGSAAAIPQPPRRPNPVSDQITLLNTAFGRV